MRLAPPGARSLAAICDPALCDEGEGVAVMTACVLVSEVSKRAIREPLAHGGLADRAKPAEAALAAVEIGDRGGEIGGAEIGPQGVDEAELGVGGFPQQEIGQPLLPARTDQEIDLRAGVAGLASEKAAEGRAGRRMVAKPAGGRVGNGIARR